MVRAAGEGRTLSFELVGPTDLTGAGKKLIDFSECLGGAGRAVPVTYFIFIRNLAG